jgi:FtsZ-binding cell division protein ZapB
MTDQERYDLMVDEIDDLKEQNASLLAELQRYREAEKEGRLIESV